MTLTTDKVQNGMEVIDLLLKNIDETTGCHSNQPWTITIHDALVPQGGGADDFLDVLLGGSDSSSAPASPLWSPSTTDSGITSDPLESPHLSSASPFPAFYTPPHPQPPPLANHPLSKLKSPSEMTSDVSIDVGWEADDLQEEFGIAYYLTTTHNSSPVSSTHTLTVKDLLLSNLGQKVQRIPQHSLQEIVLNEDEKKLLAKEGVKLPSKLPLSKFEERVLKKIRRKIRNKRSAQESRKKKREYIDSLEGRMSACSAHNLELQRKVHQLEQTNNSLLEQLSRLQVLLPNSSNKTAQRGTCILVLLLSFSFLLSSSLQPDASSQLGHREFTEAKVPSRSLQSVVELDETPPAVLSTSRGLQAVSTLMEKLRLGTSLPKTDLHPSLNQDHRH